MWWLYYVYFLVIIILFFLFVLIFSEKIQKSVFVDIFTSESITLWNEKLFATRKHYQLEKFTELKTDESAERLKVLEVGVGEGTNFEFYPDNCSLTVLEYNEFFEEKFTENVNKFSKIKFERFVNGMVEDMHEFEDNTFDAILCTHVLCSVSDVSEALNEIKRVLKEGGQFFFLEHVAWETNEFWAMVQGLLEPIWKIFMGGCRLRKSTWSYLEKADFSTVTITREYPKILPVFLRPHIWGCAVK